MTCTKATKSLNLRMTDDIWKDLKALVGKESGSYLNGYLIVNCGGRLVLERRLDC